MKDESIYSQTEPITAYELKKKIDKALNKISTQGKLSNQMVSNMKVKDVELAKI